MKRLIRLGGCALVAALLSLLPAGCGDDGGGGGGGDFGDNDKNLVACVGDSITQGFNCIGAPYPSRLAAYSGKTVKNYGLGGTHSGYGVSIIGTVLARKPGYVCILFGANDCIRGDDLNGSVENIRRIVRACKANKTRAIVATPTPMIGEHALYDPATKVLAAGIKRMAKEEGVPCVDLNAAFGDGSQYLNPDDGLHMNAAGSDLIAKKFNSKL